MRELHQPQHLAPARNEAQFLIEEIERNSRRLSQIVAEANTDSPDTSEKSDAAFRDWLKEEYRRRRLRERFIRAEILLGEPAWDLLLDLAIQRCERHVVSVTSASLASRVPTTTALRWIAILEQEGLVFRTSDIEDKRRSLVAITDAGFQALRDYFQRLP